MSDIKQKKLRMIGLITLAYSLLVLIGGVLGFALKQSIPSLVAGSLCGLFLLFSGVKTMTGYLHGLVVTFVLIFALDMFFAYRFLNTQNFFPSGLMLLITTFVIIIQLFHFKRAQID